MVGHVFPGTILAAQVLGMIGVLERDAERLLQKLLSGLSALGSHMVIGLAKTSHDMKDMCNAKLMF
jgi:hypothetical protein